MCWRGHDPSRAHKGVCRDCHAIRVRLYRMGKTPRKMAKYALDLDAFYRYRRAPIEIISQLADLSIYTIHTYLYRGGLARPENAQALAVGLGVPMEKIWRKVQ